MKRVLVVAPTRRDLLNLANGRVLARYDLAFEERPGLDGVFGSSDSTARWPWSSQTAWACPALATRRSCAATTSWCRA